jgi:hypothetical protein
MKRTELKRRTPMGRGKPLARVNRKRAAKRKAECFAEQAETCRRLPCCVCLFAPWDALPVELTKAASRGELPRISEPHHIPSRRAGGLDKDCVPLCFSHHREFHNSGEQSFGERYNVDLRAIAARIHKALQS